MQFCYSLFIHILSHNFITDIYVSTGYSILLIPYVRITCSCGLGHSLQ